MADVKISGLPASTTPLAGTEVLPVVQGGQTRQVSVSNLTLGRTVNATTFNASGLTASQAVFTDASKNLVSNALTGTGNVVMSSSPTLSSPTVDNLTFSSSGASGITYAGWVNNRPVLKQILVAFPQYFQQVLFDAGSRSVFIDSSSNDGGGSGTVAIRTSSSGSPSARLTVDGAGNATVNTGNLVIGTSGKGIDFSATAGTGTSELLADYEEGTWTPAYAFSTSGSVTQFITAGRYVKVGSVVHLTCRIATSAISSPTGDVTITGLPFTSAANSNYGAALGQVSLFASDLPIRGRLGSSAVAVSLYKNTSNNAASTLQGTDFSAGSPGNLFDLTLTYIAA
jgi:hypothetical protein